MKTILLGDTHGRPHWKKVLAQEQDADRIIFVGDYFDNPKYFAEEQILNFLHIIAYKITHPEQEVIMLIGNHDYHYFPEIGNQMTSGYQDDDADEIGKVIDQHRKHLQVCFQFDGFLVSHAGVSAVFMDNTFGQDQWQEDQVDSLLNGLFLKNPRAFRFNGTDPSGDDPQQGPLWIRVESLVRSNRSRLEKKFIQVFGHTKTAAIHKIGKITQSKYQLIDTLGTSGEYMIAEDGLIRYGKVEMV